MFDLLFSVLVGNEKTQAGGFLGYSRVHDGLDIDALLEQRAGKAGGLDRTADNGRDDGNADASTGINAGRSGFVKKQSSARLQGGHSVGFPLQAAQGGERRGGNRRRHADAVEEAWCEKPHVFHQRGFAGDVAAAGGERLAEGSHPDVNFAAGKIKVLTNAHPGVSHHAEGVGLVNHEKSAVSILDLDKPRQVRIVAVHSVDALNHDQRAFELVPLAGEDGVECGPVVVRKRQTPCTRELNSLQGTVMDQLIVDDEIPRTEEVADGADVRRVAAHESHRVFDAVRARDRPLELAVNRPFASGQAAGRHRCPVAVDGGLRGSGDLRMPRQAQVVIARKIQVLPATNARRAPGDAFVHPEKRVLHAQTSRAIMNNAHLLVTRMESKPVKLLGDLRATLIGRATCRQRVGWPDIRASLICLAQAAFEGLLDQLVLDLGGKSRQGLAGHTRATSANDANGLLRTTRGEHLFSDAADLLRRDFDRVLTGKHLDLRARILRSCRNDGAS